MATIYDNALLSQGSDTNVRLIELIPGGVWCNNEQYQVHCKFHILPLASKPRYTAVSYMWGLDNTTSDIVLNGRVLTVRNNLFDLLLRLSETAQTLLWVDAICIDQENIDERNHQVGLMGKIYAQAASVIVWLGADDRRVEKALKRAQPSPRKTRDDASEDQIGKCTDSDDDTSGIMTSYERSFPLLHSKDAKRTPLYRALDMLAVGPHGGTTHVAHTMPHEPFNELIALCQHPYWSRAWIVQELILAEDIWIRCNSVQLHLEAFEEQLSQVRGWLRGRKLIRAPRELARILESPAAKLLAKRNKWHGSHGRSYINPWDSGFGILGCSDVRDRVYAMAAVMDPKLIITPDYSKTPSEVFRDIFEQHLQRTGAFAGTIWNLQSMLELQNNDPVVRHARRFGSFEWTPVGSLASRKIVPSEQ